MSQSEPPVIRIESMEPRAVADRLRGAAQRVAPERIFDDRELTHLVHIITECSVLLKDLYTDRRIARVMRPSQLVDRLVERFLERRPDVEGQERRMVRKLPDDVRRLADKALFDHGLLGRRAVKGYDLAELGTRAYLAAGEMFELLADDRRLRGYFDDNRYLVAPLQEEVAFLRQCADKFDLYAELLRESRESSGKSATAGSSPITSTSTALALVERAVESAALDLPDQAADADRYVDAAQGRSAQEDALNRDQLLSSYERILLFSSLQLDRLDEALQATVIDQPRAVAALCDEFSLFAAGTCNLNRPPAYFLVGPTGVGKNHLVESLQRSLGSLWDLEIPMLTIEGPNYTYPSDINELRGATRGFVRSDEEGILTRFHEQSSRSPIAIILIDEVEKAHPQLITFFLSILDRGTTTDNRGDVLNFSNCLIFFTSNLGYSDQQQDASMVGFVDREQRAAIASSDIQRELRRALKPEFVNRVRLLHFDRLTVESAEHILELEFGKIARRYEQMHEIRLKLEDSAREELVRRGFSSAYGARRLAATLESICNVEIAKKIRSEDRSSDEDRSRLIQWIREVRDGSRHYDVDEVRRRVTELARLKPGYSELSIRFDGEQFHYDPGQAE